MTHDKLIENAARVLCDIESKDTGTSLIWTDFIGDATAALAPTLALLDEVQDVSGALMRELDCYIEALDHCICGGPQAALTPQEPKP